MPSPAVAFLAHQRKEFGLSITPSHNALGYVGLKGFTRTGRVFDREWQGVRTAYERNRLPSPTHSRDALVRNRREEPTTSQGSTLLDGYLHHLTGDLHTRRTVVVDCRGGATALVAPTALRRMGAQVIEVTVGYSPDFFGKSPEPQSTDLGELSRRIRTEHATVGFAFDGDGDRCLVLDGAGQPTAPEVVALLLHSILDLKQHPLVASADASRMLERSVRTYRSRVGSRYVIRKMQSVGAEVGVELSGHYYVRSFGSDSDGVLIACLIAQALDRDPSALDRWSRKVGPIHRGSFALDFESAVDAHRAFGQIARSLESRARRGPEGIVLDLPLGWGLIRCSNTQPSIRFTFESTTSKKLSQLEDKLHQLSHPVEHGCLG